MEGKGRGTAEDEVREIPVPEECQAEEILEKCRFLKNT